VSLLPADLYAIGQDLRRAAVRRERRHKRRGVAAVAGLIAAATAGVAVAASGILGNPAPHAVQADLRTAVRFALANHPRLDVQTAHVVATSRSATLYSLVAANGDYCAELLGTTYGAIYGFTCSKQLRSSSGQLLADAYAPNVSYFIGADGAAPPVVQFGRLPGGTVSARALYDNGEAEVIKTGLDRFFVYEPSSRFQTLARRIPMTIEFRDGNGLTWSYYIQPPQPLRVDGRRISGRVLVDGADRVEFNVASRPGASPRQVFVPLHADGSFAYTRAPGSAVYRVTVRDKVGGPVSSDTSVVTLSAVRAQFAALRHR
jgi:hypothetical protein